MRVLLLLALSLTPALAQKADRIGRIEFFGYSGVDIKKLKSGLPVKEGQEFRMAKPGDLAKLTIRTKEVVQRIAKRPVTDFAPVCCDSEGNWTIYIGLSGKASIYRPVPKGEVRLPAELIALYDQFMKALEQSIRRGATGEDRSKGYALSVDPEMRKVQLDMREAALKNEALLLDVLANCPDGQQRVVAAEIMGYAQQSRQQIAALADAARDPDTTVRNNATRALGVLVQSNPKLSKEIPAEIFVELLLSGEWTDLNKAAMLLAAITGEGADEKMLALLRRSDVRDRLSEMSRWPKGHCETAQHLLKISSD
jgi:hypothetical protein